MKYNYKNNCRKCSDFLTHLVTTSVHGFLNTIALNVRWMLELITHSLIHFTLSMLSDEYYLVCTVQTSEKKRTQTIFQWIIRSNYSIHTDRPVLSMLFFDKYLMLRYRNVLISIDDKIFLMWYMSECTSSCNTCQMSNPEKAYFGQG